LELQEWFWDEHYAEVDGNRAYIYPVWHVFSNAPTGELQSDGSAYYVETGYQAALLREIFGNPFHPVTIDRAWLTANVAGLAQSIYDDRAFDRLPILADALEDAGCDNADILNHCRQPGEHVRGCWVVDLVLGKT
jgi:hypothetical protein